MNWTRNDNVIWEELDGGALLVSPDTGGRWSLNSAAAAVWNLCDGRLSLSQVAARIARPLDEVSTFCQQFAALGLLNSPQPSAVTHVATFHTAAPGAPGFKAHSLGSGPRRRPTPRGLSGPA